VSSSRAHSMLDIRQCHQALETAINIPSIVLCVIFALFLSVDTVVNAFALSRMLRVTSSHQGRL